MPDSTVAIEVKGADAIIKLLGELAGMTFLNAVIEAAAHDLLDKQAEDMPGAVGQMKARPQWASRAQQVAYLASRRERGLDIKYTRESDDDSQQLMKGWNVSSLGPGQIGASLGNAATYGPFVMDKDMQTAMHKATGWPTVQGTVEKHGAEVQTKIETAIKNKIIAAETGVPLV